MTNRILPITILMFLYLLLPVAAQETTHVWSDTSGNYQLKAEFVARNESSVVLKLADKSMLIVEIDHLSRADQQYLIDLETKREKAIEATTAETERAKESSKANNEIERNEIDTVDWESKSQTRCWRLADLDTICGEVVEYGRPLVQVKKRGSRVYVNDRLFKNLPPFYQKVTISIVNQHEDLGGKSIKNEEQLRRWLSSQPKRQKAYTIEGVIIENYRGDLYGVPFFMFDERDVGFFRSGWRAWEAADKDAKYQAEMSLRLRVETMMRQRKEQAEFNMQRLHLFLEGYDAGLFDLWQVNLIPARNSNGFPLRVVVPARDSSQAQAEALKRYPNMRAGATSKARRKW